MILFLPDWNILTEIFQLIYLFTFSQVTDEKNATPKVVLAIEDKKTPEVEEAPSPPPPPPEPVKVEAPVSKQTDLLVIYELRCIMFQSFLSFS